MRNEAALLALAVSPEKAGRWRLQKPSAALADVSALGQNGYRTSKQKDRLAAVSPKSELSSLSHATSLADGTNSPFDVVVAGFIDADFTEPSSATPLPAALPLFAGR